MEKWAFIEKNIIVPILKDEVPEGSQRTRRYTSNLLISWWNNAQRRLSSMRPIEKHIQFDLTSNEISVPKQHYRPRKLLVKGGGGAGELRYVSIEDTWLADQSSPAYYIYEDKINLVAYNIVKGSRALYFYDAYFPTIENENTRVFVPEWAWEACAIYVAMQAVTREAMDTSRFNKYKSKTDSGNPEQNPFLPVAQWLEKRFNDLVVAHSDDHLTAYKRG